MFLSQRQALSLATVLATMRPDWAEKSIITFFETNAKTLPFKDFTAFAVAAVNTAVNPTAKTPAAILTWRPATRPLGDSAAAPDGSAKCADHPVYPASSCLSCTSEIKAGDRPGSMRGLHWEIPLKPETLPIETPVIHARHTTYIDRSVKD